MMLGGLVIGKKFFNLTSQISLSTSHFQFALPVSRITKLPIPTLELFLIFLCRDGEIEAEIDSNLVEIKNLPSLCLVRAISKQQD